MTPTRTTCLLLSCMLLLFAGCDTTVERRPRTPHDAVQVCGVAALQTPSAQALLQALEAPVVYLGRSERPFRVENADAAPALQDAATVVVLQSSASRPAACGLADLPIAARVAQDSVSADGVVVSWSTFLNPFLPEQTVIRVQLPPALDVQTAALLGYGVRDHLERSQLHHQRQRLLQGEGATWMPRRGTRDAFRVVVPDGYAWSDTSSGWPESVTIAAARPTRVVTVFWLEDASPDWIDNRAFLVGLLRDAMWRLQGDRLSEEAVTWSSSAAGLELESIWQNPERIAGGPMAARFVYDAARQRLYGVQSLVFLPGGDKHRALREARALASTFSIEEER